MSIHIGNLCKTVNFHIRSFCLVPVKLTSNGSNASEIRQPRLVFACGRDRCSADLINSLHWLPVKDRICFKMMLYVYKYIMNVAPSYFCDLITLFSDSQTVENRPRFRSSSDTTKLLVPRSRKRAGDHSFVVAAPRLRKWVTNSAEGGGFCACFQTFAENTFVQMLGVLLYFCLASFLPAIL